MVEIEFDYCQMKAKIQGNLKDKFQEKLKIYNKIFS